jgi:hypothetical protein
VARRGSISFVFGWPQVSHIVHIPLEYENQNRQPIPATIAKSLILFGQFHTRRLEINLKLWNVTCPFGRTMTIRGAESSAESRKWLTRFSLRTMTAPHVSRCAAIQLTDRERSLLTKSIQQFQLGEGSRGQRLLKRAQKYGRAMNDPHFADAVALFIKEEQQHSAYLAAFMESQCIPRVSRHWVDTIFRQLRGLAGLELSLTVLVTAEIIAVPYYRALRNATKSPTLKIICTRILEDETKHLEFQASMLARIAANRPPLLHRILTNLHGLFLLGTIVVVWREHRSALELGGYDFGRFKSETLRKFSDWSYSRRSWKSRTVANQFPGSPASGVDFQRASRFGL